MELQYLRQHGRQNIQKTSPVCVGSYYPIKTAIELSGSRTQNKQLAMWLEKILLKLYGKVNCSWITELRVKESHTPERAWEGALKPGSWGGPWESRKPQRGGGPRDLIPQKQTGPGQVGDRSGRLLPPCGGKYTVVSVDKVCAVDLHAWTCKGQCLEGSCKLLAVAARGPGAVAPRMAEPDNGIHTSCH